MVLELPGAERTGVRQDADMLGWLRAHQSGIGGSEAAAVLGVHPYSSALEVYAHKIATVTGDDLVDVSEAALWGRLFERPILDEYARRSGRVVVPGGELVRSRRVPYLICTLDGEVHDNARPTPGMAEVKTTGFGERYPRPGDHEGELPIEVQIQVQHDLAVTGLEWGVAIWLPFPERRLQWRDVRAHPEFQAELAEKLGAFWARVQDRRPPDPDGSQSSKRALATLYGDHDGTTVALDESWLVVRDELQTLAGIRKQVEAREELLKQQLKSVIGPAQFGDLPDGSSYSLLTTHARHYTCEACGHEKMKEPFRAPRFRQPPKARRQLDAARVAGRLK